MLSNNTISKTEVKLPILNSELLVANCQSIIHHFFYKGIINNTQIKIKIKTLSCNSAGGREHVADAGVLSPGE